MISDFTRAEMAEAINNAADYSKGKKRKQLQSAYDKMLNELSEYWLNEPCSSRMLFRQRINEFVLTNSNQKQLQVISAIKEMTKNEHLLFRKDYRDHSSDVEIFLTNHIHNFLKVANNG